MHIAHLFPVIEMPEEREIEKSKKSKDGIIARTKVYLPNLTVTKTLFYISYIGLQHSRTIMAPSFNYFHHILSRAVWEPFCCLIVA